MLATQSSGEIQEVKGVMHKDHAAGQVYTWFIVFQMLDNDGKTRCVNFEVKFSMTTGT